MVMVHGDDKGLVIMPPCVAPLQVIIVSILSKKLMPEQVDPYCQSILKDLEWQGVSMLAASCCIHSLLENGC
jgi:hypothetical protein